MDARETAERHGGFVVAGNMQSVMADFASPEALQAFAAQGKTPPRPTTAYEIVNQSGSDTNPVFDIKYSNDHESLTVRSTWGKQGDEWKIVSADAVS
jgi:hypothetical protein